MIQSQQQRVLTLLIQKRRSLSLFEKLLFKKSNLPKSNTTNWNILNCIRSESIIKKLNDRKNVNNLLENTINLELKLKLPLLLYISLFLTERHSKGNQQFHGSLNGLLNLNECSQERENNFSRTPYGLRICKRADTLLRTLDTTRLPLDSKVQRRVCVAGRDQRFQAIN